MLKKRKEVARSLTTLTTPEKLFPELLPSFLVIGIEWCFFHGGNFTGVEINQATRAATNLIMLQ